MPTEQGQVAGPSGADGSPAARASGLTGRPRLPSCRGPRKGERGAYVCVYVCVGGGGGHLDAVHAVERRR